MSDATSVDATSVLFGLEDEFGVLDVERVATGTVKVVIEQKAREGPCPECGVLSSAIKDRPVTRVKDLPACGSDRRAVVAETSPRVHRDAVPTADIHPGLLGGAAPRPGDRAAAGAGG